MPCLITGGIVKDCNYLVGGLSALYLANKDDIDSYTDTTPDDGIINDIVMVATKVFFSFEFDDETASFNNELTVSGGQKYITQTVSLTSSVKTPAVIAELKNLSLAKLVAVAVDRNGQQFILGRTNGLEASVQTLGSGAAAGDAAGLALTLAGVDVEWSQTYTGVVPV